MKPFSITAATKNEFLSAKKEYKNKLLFDSNDIKKKNGKIKLPVNLKWKPFYIFKDTSSVNDETNMSKYQYLGRFANVGFYVVAGHFFEHYECYLINKSTGVNTTIWNTPYISPNDKYIANLSMEYGLEGVANGIQIWKIVKQELNQEEPITIEKFLELDQMIWVPKDVVWENDNSLILKVISVENQLKEITQIKRNDYYFLRVNLQ